MKNNHPTVKIFAGFKLTASLKMHLSQSRTWKEYSVIKLHEHSLVIVPYNRMEFVGAYLPFPAMTAKDVQKQAKIIAEGLQKHIPEYEIDIFQLFFFPQVFVA